MQNILLRHLITAIITAGLTWLFWRSRMEWDPEMRLWKSFGDTSLVLLYATLAIGPAARFFKGAGRLIKYRHELGVWFGVYGLIHTFLILNGWMRWEVGRFLGYEFIPSVGRDVRLESGFGMANIMGLIAIIIAIPLMITSGNWAIRYLGGSSWKFLHLSVYPILYLIALHTMYFMYIHYTISFHRAPAPTNWAQIPFALATGGLFAMQAAAYTRTFLKYRRRETRIG